MHPPLSLFWDACRPSLFCISTEVQEADSSATYAGLFLSAKNDSDQYSSTYFVGSGKNPIVSFEQNVKIHVRFIFSWSVKLLPYLWIFGCFFHVSTWLLLSARTVYLVVSSMLVHDYCWVQGLSLEKWLRHYHFYLGCNAETVKQTSLSSKAQIPLPLHPNPQWVSCYSCLLSFCNLLLLDA